MPDISITVTDKRPACNAGTTVVCDNSDYIVHWDLDAEWSAYDTKTMRVIYMDSTYADIVFSGDSVALPPVPVPGCVQIGLYAGDIHTSRMALLRALSSVRSASGAPANPTPDVYDQLMERMAQLETPDWNQNDPTAKDYIKNRTHWVDDDGTVHKLDEKFLPETSAVSFAAQSLTDSQKAQARENIGAQEKICEEVNLDTSAGFGYIGLINAAGYYPKTIYKARIGGDYYENVPCNNYGNIHPEYTLGEHTITLNYNAGSMDVSPNDISDSDIEFYKQESVQVILPKHIPNAPLIVTITKDANDSYSADKTNAEIYAAYEKGTYIRVECSWAPYVVGSLFTVGPDQVVFMFDLKAVPYFGSFSGFVAVVIHPNGVEVTTVDNPLILPPAGTEAGSVWTIDENDGPTWKALPTALPAVTTADNGKVLKVVDGAWAVVDA